MNGGNGSRLYPTVITDRFTLESAGAALRMVVVYAPEGRKVYEKSLSTFSETLAWPENALPGLYFVEVGLADGSRMLHKVWR